MPVTINGTTGVSLVESGALPFLVGQVCFFAMDTAPEGFIKCNGAEISRSIFADLFAAIGTTFGAGDGSTTFNLPDMRGEFPRGWDDGRGVDSGRSFGAAQLDQMQRITGSAGGNLVITSGSTSGQSGALNRPIGGDTNGIDGAAGFFSPRNITLDSANSPNARASSTTSGETRSRNIALLACIKF